MPTIMVTLLVSLILLALFELNFSNSPYSRNHTMNQEWNAINEGRETVERELNSFLFRKHLLCVTFVNSTHEASKKNLIENMKLSYSHCDWAIVIYGGSKHEICNNHDYLKYFVFCNHTHALKKHPDLMSNFQHIPKPLLYFDLLPYLPDYQYVVLFDEDISLQAFNFHIYNQIFHCSFYPSPPPLISQGLVREETQDFPFLRPSGWEYLPDVVASETLFIEQQMPFFNAIFFQWFVEYVMSRAVPKIIETGSTWVSFLFLRVLLCFFCLYLSYL
jgi:hypothetical protein